MGSVPAVLQQHDSNDQLAALQLTKAVGPSLAVYNPEEGGVSFGESPQVL